FKWVTIALSVLVSIAGIIAVSQLNQELLPRIEFPQSVIIAFNSELDSQMMLDEVTIPIEEAIGDVDGVVNIESTSSAGVAVIIVRNEFGIDQEALRDELRAAVGSLDYPAGMETPELLSFSLSDLPVVAASVSSSELTLPELKALVEADIIPALEDVSGIADVEVSGGQELPEDLIAEADAADATAPAAATPTPEATATLEPVEPQRLPLTFMAGARAVGVEVSRTDEVTPEVLGEILDAAGGTDEQILAVLNLLPADLLPAVPPETLAVLPIEYIETLDPALQAELDARAAEFGGVGQFTVAEAVAELTDEPTLAPVTATAAPAATETPEAEVEATTAAEPVPLPDTWTQAAAAQGLELETTADLDAEIVGGIASFAPALLDDLTPEMLQALPAETLAALPQDYLAGLDPELAQELAERLPGEQAEELPGPEPQPLPQSWAQAAAAQGLTLETTADITPQVMEGIVGLAPQLLSDLEPAMWRAIDPAALAVALPEVEAQLDPDLNAQLQAIARAGTGQEPEPVALPQSWVQAAAGAGLALETSADLTPEGLEQLASFAPQLLADLNSELLLALTPQQQAALPDEYVAQLDEGLQETLAIMALRDAQLRAARVEDEAELEEAAAPAATPDPARLPDVLIQGAQSFGLDIEFADEIEPEFMRQIGALGPQGLQVLQLMTADNLRALQPEAIALLPPEFVETLEPDLRADLDALAADFGGAGRLAEEEAEAAAAVSADAPELAESWRGSEDDGAQGPTFETAADLINNGFAPTAAEFLNLLVSSGQTTAPTLIGDLTPEVMVWLQENEENFLQNLSPGVLRLLSPETISALSDDFLATLDPELRTELEGIAAGTVEVFIPEDTITRVNGRPSLSLLIFKDGEANTVTASEGVFDALDELESANGGLTFDVAFEQASFIEESISGVAREGALGALFAVVVILVFLSGRKAGGEFIWSWRSTIVAGVSIPLSILMAFAMIRWLPLLMNPILQPLADATASVPLLGGLTTALNRLFPTNMTLNIMTLSGMTVAIGRVVDDSIVVLENTFRHMQRGEEPRHSVLVGTRDVSIAILSSTITTMVVFLPIGLIGGLISEFFLQFGVAVSYALAASFVVAVTIVPLLAFLFIRRQDLPSGEETALQRQYTPLLRWALNHRLITLVVTTVLFAGSMWLFGQRPQAFLPELGEVQITVNVNLTDDSAMAETDDQVMAFEEAIQDIEGLGTILVEVGSSGGLEAQFLGGSVNQSTASVQIQVEDADAADELTALVRQEAVAIFGPDNVLVSSGTLSSSGFGGFGLVLSGDPAVLAEVNDDVLAELTQVEGLANPTSNLTDENSILRVDGESAVRFTGELETEDALGVTRQAIELVQGVVPDSVTVSEGFETQQQTEGFAQAIQAIFISIIAVYVVMVITFRSFVHPFTILFSLPVAIIGAAVALWVTDRVVGLSALVGMMMLVGIVVTNAIVLLDRVQANRSKRGMSAREALIEGGRTRLRPILMTALATMMALLPLAAGFSEGAIVAEELGTVVIGGLFSSTALTLLVVPVMYGLL
ncbi:MAG: efflux RND transporter permease subunit, partial [Candidatus Promineifilaceae bacterium]|nr:efflux RND transporter permease subunit [Candidatus Promineifilaceae bacterium]